MASRFGEEGRRLSYGSYLKIPEPLALQDGLSHEHDELRFIVAHQVYELWFKVVLFELEAARDRIAGGSSGAEYLRTTLGKRFYPELWDVRSNL